ncbi:MAG TPA: hypothetical protein VIK11_02790 [Tepidiformaceae bacterium]
MAVYRLTRYPRQVELDGGQTVMLRPMVQGDVPVVSEFFARLPEMDRFFLKEDVASAAVVRGWGTNLNYDRALPLLAFEGDRVVADSVLFRHRGGYRQHLGGIRVSVAPELASTNLASVLMRDLIEIAWDSELEGAELELVDQAQDQLIKAAEDLGAVRIATVARAVKDSHGEPRDLVFLRIPLGRSWEWWKVLNEFLTPETALTP